MTARYEVGELVDVLIRNGRIVEADATSVMVEAKDMDAMWLDLNAVQVTRVAPKEWPPQPSDIWEDRDGRAWVGVGVADNTYLHLINDGRTAQDCDVTLEHHGPMRLEYRRGWSPKPEPAGPPTGELVELDERAEQIAGLRELADLLEACPELPISKYELRSQVHVSNLPHMRGKDEPAMFAELSRVAALLDVEADLRDEKDAMHPHATRTFRGGVQYEVVYVTKAYKRGYKPVEDLPGAGEEVAGPGAGSATAPAESAAGDATAPADEAHTAGTPESGGASAASPVPDSNGDGVAVTPAGSEWDRVHAALVQVTDNGSRWARATNVATVLGKSWSTAKTTARLQALWSAGRVDMSNDRTVTGGPCPGWRPRTRSEG